MTILQEPNALLRATATLVEKKEITSGAIEPIIKKMQHTLDQEDDGVAIAAPQIGISKRIFVVSKKVSKKLSADIIFINPEIVRLGKQKSSLTEGCLSVRWKYGHVKRANTTTVRALNKEGNEFVMSGRGLLAQIFQHEIDHLNGILFIDKATGIEEIPPQNK